MNLWLVLLGAPVVSIAVSAAVMSLVVGYPFDWTRGQLRSSDELLDRAATRARAGEDQAEVLRDELRRGR